jgi:hypothetical protein
MAEYKLDIFQTLAAADTKQMDWLEKQPAEAQKAFSPLVFMRWLSSVNGSVDLAEWHLCAVNEYMNTDFWALADYPDLLYKLGCMAGVGKRQKHDWIPMASTRKAKNKALEFLAELNPRSSWEELDMIIGLHTIDTFKELLIECGVQKEQEKELLASFKKIK